MNNERNVGYHDVKNRVKSKCVERSHTQKKTTTNALYGSVTITSSLSVLENRGISHNNINHRQAKYHVGPHLAHDGVLVKPFRELL